MCCVAEVNPKSQELNNTGKVEAGRAREQGLELPFSAIQNLARLIEAQRRQSELSLQNLRASPFQGRPISPPKADSKTSSELAMRHCFSESSADGLGALSKQVCRPFLTSTLYKLHKESFKSEPTACDHWTAGAHQIY